MTVGTHPAWQNWRYRNQPSSAPSAPPVERTSWLSLLAIVPISCALSLHWILVLINTHVTPVTDNYVIGGEALILAMTCLIIGISVRARIMGLLLVMLAYFTILWMIRGFVDPKNIRDMIIPVIFYELGRTRGSYETADKLMIWSSLVVLLVAAVEMIWPVQYGEQFNVLRYYIARGEIPEEAALFYGTNYSINGQRPEGIGRSLMPFLGPHRASSIFIEPVSLGNYGVIAWAWFLMRPSKPLVRAMLMGVAAMLIVLCDSRFGAITAGVVLVFWWLRHIRLMNLVIPIMPIAILLTLGFMAMVLPVTIRGDNLIGRLIYSGQYLFRMPTDQWLGVGRFGRYAFDSGYADVIRNVGIIGIGMTWVLICASFQREQQRFFKVFITVYYSLVLCISASVFSIKSAAIVWFIFGCLGAKAAADARKAEAEGLDLEPTQAQHVLQFWKRR